MTGPYKNTCEKGEPQKSVRDGPRALYPGLFYTLTLVGYVCRHAGRRHRGEVVNAATERAVSPLQPGVTGYPLPHATAESTRLNAHITLSTDIGVHLTRGCRRGTASLSSLGIKFASRKRRRPETTRRSASSSSRTTSPFARKLGCALLVSVCRGANK